MFAGSSVFQCVDVVGQFAAVEEFEPDFSVFFFVVSRFFKESFDLFVACFFSYAGIIGVLVAGLGLTCKGSL